MAAVYKKINEGLEEHDRNMVRVTALILTKKTALSLTVKKCGGTRAGDLDHVSVVEDLAQVDAKINNLAAGAPRERIQL